MREMLNSHQACERVAMIGRVLLLWASCQGQIGRYEGTPSTKFRQGKVESTVL